MESIYKIINLIYVKYGTVMVQGASINECKSSGLKSRPYTFDWVRRYISTDSAFEPYTLVLRVNLSPSMKNSLLIEPAGIPAKYTSVQQHVNS